MIRVYTGDGQGKTTTALGLGLRAYGAGLKVYMIQFMKGKMYCSECEAVKKIADFDIVRFGRSYFVKKEKVTQKDKELAQRGLGQARKIVASGKYDVVILDEINVALGFGLLELEDVLDLIKATPKKIELVLTGRAAHPELIKLADLVTEMREVKHYYKKGMKARRGFEY